MALLRSVIAESVYVLKRESGVLLCRTCVRSESSVGSRLNLVEMHRASFVARQSVPSRANILRAFSNGSSASLLPMAESATFLHTGVAFTAHTGR